MESPQPFSMGFARKEYTVIRVRNDHQTRLRNLAALFEFIGQRRKLCFLRTREHDLQHNVAGTDIRIDTVRLWLHLEILGCRQERRDRQKLRSALSNLSDRKLMDIGTTRGEIDDVVRTRDIDPRGIRSGTTSIRRRPGGGSWRRPDAPIRAGLYFRYGYQKRPSDVLPFTSGLPPSTDIVGVRRHVAKVPQADLLERRKQTLIAAQPDVEDLGRSSVLVWDPPKYELEACCEAIAGFIHERCPSSVCELERGWVPVPLGIVSRSRSR